MLSSSSLKYHPGVVPLSLDHEYLQTHPAPDFWALAPFYIGQRTNASCSVASLVPILNALRSSTHLSARDELITEEHILKTVNDTEWNEAVQEEGDGISFEDIKDVADKVLRAYHLSADTERVYIDGANRDAKEMLRRALIENEQSAHDFILLDFNQGDLVGDVNEGHISPVGAYDNEKERVLIMDVDRVWYEPYWVPIDMLLQAMTLRPETAGQSEHGLVRIMAR